MQRAWSESHPITMVGSPVQGAGGDGCDDGACAV
jgi:hypothetical protein